MQSVYDVGSPPVTGAVRTCVPGWPGARRVF